ncbi:hypothetical protein Sango_1041800 [Sesamum angolense]|uniref:Uncharacterized protein n=1 Tax=Sesamum angolense TaxID=2727404 RepID=A0AAE2BZ26_9LAMI|nr:hypothetical protein Sango_1041800 [Sesamum angolense]
MILEGRLESATGEDRSVGDSTSICELLSEIDASQGYHQIMLAPEDPKRLHPYFLGYPIRVRMNLQLKQTLGKSNTSRQLVKWVVELSEYDVSYLLRTAIKAEALANFVSETMRTPLEETPNKELWLLHVDGSAKT